MSKKPSALEAYLKLKKRADAGDPQAKADITKLASNPKFISMLKKAAQQNTLTTALAVRAADDIVGEDEEEIGVDDAGGGHFDEDDIERADWLARKMSDADSLTQKVAYRNANWHQLNQTAPFQRINPPSSLQGTLGGQQEVTTDSTQQVALWGGVDAETLPVTVTAAYVASLADSLRTASGMGLRPYAILKFGTRGFLVRAEIDVGTGFQLTVGASYVSLEMALDPSGDTGPVKLSGMLSFYPCVRTAQLTRTLYQDVAHTATTVAAVIPAFAKNVVIRRDDPTVDVTVLLLDSHGATRDSFELAPVATGLDQVDPVPLMGEIVAYKVINNDMAKDVKVGLIFGLSL